MTMRTKLLHKLARYATVSAISTSISMTILGVLVATSATTAGWANVIATAVGTVPSFELNRRWVWGKAGSRSLASEIGPFCSLSFAALGLSTVAVSTSAGWAATSGLGPTARTIAAEAASVATFGMLWILQFVLLDRILFRHDCQIDASSNTPAASPAVQIAVDTGHLAA
jgi:putative flippase GtrA